MSSPDGITWTSRSASAASAWSAVTYGNRVFVAVASGTSGTLIMSSPDGTAWTSRTAPASTNSFSSVTYGEGLFVAVSTAGTNRVMTSTNGTTWTSRTAAEANAWTSVTYGDGKFVAVANSGTNRVMTSPDGITWTARAASQANAWKSVAFVDGVFVAIATSGTNRVMTSTDGETWTNQNASAANTWNFVTAANKMAVVVASTGTGNRVMTSGTWETVFGETWTSQSSPENRDFRNIAYGKGLFIALPYTSTITTGMNSAYKSQDGVNWTAISSTGNGTLIPGTWSTFSYQNGRFVAVKHIADGDGSKVAYSTNGTDWNYEFLIAPDEGGSLTIDHMYKNMRFVAIAHGKWHPDSAARYFLVADTTINNRQIMLSSTDLKHWQKDGIQVGKATQKARDIAFGQGTFAVVGENLLNTFDQTWFNANVRGTAYEVANNWTSVAFGNPQGTGGRFVAVASSGSNARVATFDVGTPMDSQGGWVFRKADADYAWNKVIFSNGQFIAFAESGSGERVMTSPDGIEWTLRKTPADNSWKSAAAGNGIVVAVSNTGSGNRVMTTGTFAAPQGPRMSAATVGVKGGRFAQLFFEVTDSSGTEVQDAGLYFGTAANPSSAWPTVKLVRKPHTREYEALVWGLAPNTTYHVRAWGSSELGTVTGTNFSFTTGSLLFSEQAFTASGGSGIGPVSDVMHKDGQWLAVESGNTTSRLLTSPDGVNWSARTIPGGRKWKALAASPGRFAALASNSTSQTDSLAMVSDNSLAWTLKKVTQAEYAFSGVESPQDIAFGDGGFVAVSKVFQAGNKVWRSSDGTTWAEDMSGSWLSGDKEAIAFGKGKYVSVGYGIDYSTSHTPALNWAGGVGVPQYNYENPPLYTFTDVAFVNNHFIAVSAKSTETAPFTADNRIWISEDGISWVPSSVPVASMQLWSVTYAEGMYIASYTDPVAQKAGVLLSPNGKGWFVGQELESYTKISKLTYADGLLLGAVAKNGTQRFLSIGTFAPQAAYTVQVVTEPVLYFASTSAVLNGEVVKNGGAGTNERGFVRGTAQNPTTANNKVAVGGGNGAFSTTITGLTANTTYYVRTYLIKGGVTTYGNQVSFTTSGLVFPLVTTGAASSLTDNSVVLGGTATRNGAGQERGIVYNTSPNPTISNNKVQMGTGDGPFSGTVSGLSPNTEYYMRAYAKNTVGTTYGSTVVVKTRTAELLGTNWNSGTVELNEKWSKPAYGNGKWVATSPRYLAPTNNYAANPDGYYRISVSSDGENWNTNRSVVTYRKMSSARFLNDRFYIFGYSESLQTDDATYWSMDGESWTKFQLPKMSRWIAGAYGNGKYLAISAIDFYANTPPDLAESTDGITWTLRQGPSGSLNNMVFEAGKFLILGANSVKTSPDGVTWTEVPSSVRSAYQYIDAAFADGVLVVTSARGYAISTDSAKTFTLVSNIQTNGGFSGIAYVNGQFLMSQVNGNLWSSPDGINWTTYAMPDGAAGPLAYANGALVMHIDKDVFSGSSRFIVSGSKKEHVAAPQTGTIQAITSTGAQISGIVNGTGTITARGVVVGTSPLPTVSGTKFISGNGTGAFSATISGLISDKLYYVRTFAETSTQAWYGTQRAFRTAPGSARTDSLFPVSTTSILLRGESSQLNPEQIAERGFVVHTASGPTIAHTKIPVDGKLGIYSHTLSGLTAQTTYYVRAYVLETGGTVHYGREIAIQTPRQPRPVIVPDTLFDGSITYVTYITATGIELRARIKSTSTTSTITRFGLLVSEGPLTEFNESNIYHDTRSPYNAATGPQIVTFNNLSPKLTPATAYNARLFFEDSEWGRVLGDSVFTFTTPESMLGFDWSLKPQTVKRSLSSVTSGNGIFLASGPDVVAKSADGGTTWENVTMPANETWTKVAFMNGKFFAFCTDGYYTSTNATVWSTKTVLDVAVKDAAWTPVVPGPGGIEDFYWYVITSSTKTYASNDGLTWTEMKAGTASMSGNAIEYDPLARKFVIVRDASAGGSTPSMYVSDIVYTFGSTGWNPVTTGTGYNWRAATFTGSRVNAYGYNPTTNKSATWFGNDLNVGYNGFLSVDNPTRKITGAETTGLVTLEFGEEARLQFWWSNYNYVRNAIFVGANSGFGGDPVDRSDASINYGVAVVVSAYDSLNVLTSGTFRLPPKPVVKTRTPERKGATSLLAGATLVAPPIGKSEIRFGVAFSTAGPPVFDSNKTPDYTSNPSVFVADLNSFEYTEAIPATTGDDRKYERNVHEYLEKNRRYFVQAFAVTESDTVYGDLLEFYEEGPVQRWTKATASPQGDWGKAQYGNGFYLTVGGEGDFLRSSDGENWSVIETSGLEEVSPFTPYSFRFVDGWFFYTGYNLATQALVLMKSVDGSQWINANQGSEPFHLFYDKIAGRYFHQMATAQFAFILVTSSDGQNWELTTLNNPSIITSVAYGNGTYVATFNASGTQKSFAYSSDGKNWTNATHSFGALEIRDVKFGNNTFLAFVHGEDYLFKSTDGISWSRAYFQNTFGFGVTAIGHTGAQWVVAHDAGRVLLSADGTTWEAEQIEVQEYFSINAFLNVPDGLLSFVTANGDFGVLKRKNSIEISVPVMASHARQITGTAGWRMLASPRPNFTAGHWAEQTAVQGIPGGANPNASPNFYLFDSTGTWRRPSSMSETIRSGFGFIVKFFNNDQAGSKKLPLTLRANGSEPTADVTVSLNKTVLSGTGEEAAYFTLLGNPFGTRLPLSELILNNGDQLSEHVWIWDNASSDYELVSRANTVLEPWQGFWAYVLPESDATKVTYPFNKRTMNAATTGRFKTAGTDSSRAFFTLAKDGKDSYPFVVQLHKDASYGLDRFDAQKLIPLADSFAVIAGRQVDKTTLRAIEALPVNLDRVVELAIIPQIVKQQGIFELKWNGFDRFPAELTLEIVDLETGERYDARTPGSISFVQSRAKAISSGDSGNLVMSAPVERFQLRIIPNTVANEVVELPKEVSLSQNFPNPFNPTTTIRFALPESSRARLQVYDILGRRVAVLVDGLRTAGFHQVSFDASRFASGVYLYRLEAGGKVFTKKMMLIK
jgi:hypothetical protein